MIDYKFNKKTDNLFKAILALQTKTEAEKFFRDLCTIEEIKGMAERWEIVNLLEKGLPYREISKETGASTTTIARVSLWLKNGASGYRLILDRLSDVSHHKNSS